MALVVIAKEQGEKTLNEKMRIQSCSGKIKKEGRRREERKEKKEERGGEGPKNLRHYYYFFYLGIFKR